MNIDIEKIKADGQRMAVRNAFAAALRRMADLPQQDGIEYATQEQFYGMLKELDAVTQSARILFDELQKIDPPEKQDDLSQKSADDFF